MDFQSAMETFAEAWVAANSKSNIDVNGPQSEALALTTRDREEDGARSPAPRTPTPLPPHHHDTPDKSISGKSLPVHCIVEAVWTVEEWERGWGRPGGGLEADSYVIIPVGTAFADLVPVALSRLGYSRDNAAAAKGSVIIKNWKPLSFDKIAESPLMTVGDILGELSTIATLRIQIFRARPSVLTEMKEKLLRLLLVQSHSLLVSSGCPLGEGMMNQMVRNDSLSDVSEELRRKFDSWWEKQTARSVMGRRGTSPWYGASPEVPPPIPPRPCHEPMTQTTPDKKPPQDENLHPAIQTVQNQYPTQKTRMRTSFDPELELPKLQRWFHENPHPSRQQIQQYVKELNSLESRRGRKPLDVNNVVYWFKNARAAQKRAEVRTMTPGLAGMSMNGYNSSSESPSDTGGIMSKSPGSHEDDDLEEDDRPSPSPLSLTTRQPQSSPQNLSDQRPQSRDGVKTEASDDGHHTPIDNNNVINNNNNNNTPKEEQMSEDEEDEMEETVSDAEEPKEDKGKVFPRTDMMSRGGFPMVNSMFGQSMLYMGHYIQSLGSAPHQTPPLNLSSLQDERRKRNRTFIDPVSEVPRLEQWFALNTHPSHSLILKYTDDLNRMPYRQKFPPLEPKNVQFWFKNRRAKCKRLKMSLFDPQPGSHQPFHLPLTDPYHNH